MDLTLSAVKDEVVPYYIWLLISKTCLPLFLCTSLNCYQPCAAFRDCIFYKSQSTDPCRNVLSSFRPATALAGGRMVCLVKHVTVHGCWSEKALQKVVSYSIQMMHLLPVVTESVVVQ